MIAGGVLVAAVLMVVVNNNLNMAANSFESGDYSTRLQNYLSTGTETDDGDWVIIGDNQYSNVPGYVGIGTTNPQAKLEVSGKILMDDVTVVSDSANTVATKGYVDARQVRVSGSCASGSSIRVVNADGTVTCQVDNGILPGQGSIGVVDINSSQVQRRVNGTCSVGSYVTAIGIDGSVTCNSSISNTTWNASGANQYSLVSGNVGIGTSSPAQKLEVNGSGLFTGDVCNGAGACLSQLNSFISSQPISGGTSHDRGLCTAAGGTLIYEATLANPICRFNASSCPAGWAQFQNWSTTAVTTFADQSYCCSTMAGGGCLGTCPCNGPCTTGSHPWGDVPRESCTHRVDAGYTWPYSGSCVNAIGYATITQIGCA